MDVLDRAAELCESMSDEDDTLVREITAKVADKWSFWVLHELGEHGRLRFSRIMDRVEGISQKSLTKTLRQLERDGFLTRTMFLEVPLRVEYELTELGAELIRQVMPLWTWIAENIPQFQAARVRFEGTLR